MCVLCCGVVVARAAHSVCTNRFEGGEEGINTISTTSTHVSPERQSTISYGIYAKNAITHAVAAAATDRSVTFANVLTLGDAMVMVHCQGEAIGGAFAVFSRSSRANKPPFVMTANIVVGSKRSRILESSMTEVALGRSLRDKVTYI